MKQLTDEEVQRLLDEALDPEPSGGVDDHQKIHRESSGFSAPPSEDSVNAIIQVVYHKTERRSAFKAYVAIGLCLMTGMLLFLIVTYYVDSLLAARILGTIVRLKWLVVFSVFVVLFSIGLERLFLSNNKDAFRRK